MTKLVQGLNREGVYEKLDKVPLFVVGSRHNQAYMM